MKHIITNLMVAATVFMGAMGAKAQQTTWKPSQMAVQNTELMRYSVGLQIGDTTVLTTNSFSALRDQKMEKRADWMLAYTTEGTISGKLTLVTWNKAKNDIDWIDRTGRDTTAHVHILDVGALTGNAKYAGATAYLFAFDKNANDTRPFIIVDYVPATPANQGPLASTLPKGQTGSGQQGGRLSPGQVYIDPATGEQRVVIQYPDGTISSMPILSGSGQGQAPQGGATQNGGGNTVVLPYASPDGTLVYDPNTKKWDVPTGVKEIKLAEAQASANGSSTDGGWQKMKFAPDEKWVNPSTGEIGAQDRRTVRVLTNRGYGVGTNPDEDHQPNTWPNAMAAKFSSIDGSGSAGSGGILVGGGLVGTTTVFRGNYNGFGANPQAFLIR